MPLAILRAVVHLISVYTETLIAAPLSYIHKPMNTWDEAKRRKTLTERGLDFADAEKVFEGDHFDSRDDRRDYGEPRFITAGWLNGRFVVLVWTPRDGGRRIISMRYGHDHEEERYRQRLG